MTMDLVMAGVLVVCAAAIVLLAARGMVLRGMLLPATPTVRAADLVDLRGEPCSAVQLDVEVSTGSSWADVAVVCQPPGVRAVVGPGWMSEVEPAALKELAPKVAGKLSHRKLRVTMRVIPAAVESYDVDGVRVAVDHLGHVTRPPVYALLSAGLAFLVAALIVINAVLLV